MNPTAIYGSWRLLSFSHTILDTGKQTHIMGDKPNGMIIFTEDNCVSVMITAQERGTLVTQTTEQLSEQQTSALYHSMMAYSGRYHLKDNICYFDIEMSWNPSWVGLKLEREFSFDGEKLVIDTCPQVGIDGNLSKATLIWQRVN